MPIQTLCELKFLCIEIFLLVHMINSTWARNMRNTNSWLYRRFPHVSHSAQLTYFFSNHLVNHQTDIHDTAKTMYLFRLTFLVEAANEITPSHRFNLIINREWECNMCELISLHFCSFATPFIRRQKNHHLGLVEGDSRDNFQKISEFFMGIIYKKELKMI